MTGWVSGAPRAAATASWTAPQAWPSTPTTTCIIVDSKNHRVQKFTADGQFISKWGTEGTGEGELGLPWGISIDNDGDTPSSPTGATTGCRSSPPPASSCSPIGKGDLSRPTSVDTDSQGLGLRRRLGQRESAHIQPRGRAGFETLTGDATISKWGKDKLDANAEMWQERDDRPRHRARERLFWGACAVEVDDRRPPLRGRVLPQPHPDLPQAAADVLWGPPLGRSPVPMRRNHATGREDGRVPLPYRFYVLAILPAAGSP